VADKLLATYLNDHLAGATAGLELAKRTASSNEENEFGDVLARIAREIEEDRETLRSLMRTLDVSEDSLKKGAAWTAEKLGRFKPNGRLLSYSPLSRLIEFEGLALGITGKKALWKSLAHTLSGEARATEFDFEALAARAAAQVDALEPLRLQAAALAFAPGVPAPTA
jgi:hypothetical protein